MVINEIDNNLLVRRQAKYVDRLYWGSVVPDLSKLIRYQ